MKKQIKIKEDMINNMQSGSIIYDLAAIQGGNTAYTKVDKVIGLEARGFIIGGAIAKELKCSFIPIRKAGKLPSKTIAQDYELEYGKATLEMHEDSLSAGDKVLIVDDLLATGGTAEAGIALVEKLGGEILGCSFIINLPDLGGSKKLEKMGISTHFLCEFEGL